MTLYFRCHVFACTPVLRVKVMVLINSCILCNAWIFSCIRFPYNMHRSIVRDPSHRIYTNFFDTGLHYIQVCLKYPEDRQICASFMVCARNDLLCRLRTLLTPLLLVFCVICIVAFLCLMQQCHLLESYRQPCILCSVFS